MSRLRLLVHLSALGLLAVGSIATGIGGRAEASVVIDIFQSGGNVVTMGGGTINLDGLSLMASAVPSGAPGLVPNDGGVFVGPNDAADSYTGISGPLSFGPGGEGFEGSSPSGDIFGVAAVTIFGQSILLVPNGYVSGTALAGSAIYDGQTLASLGLTPGTYVYTWGPPAADDSLTVKIGSIPEPSTWAMMLLGFAGLGYAGYRRAKRNSPAFTD